MSQRLGGAILGGFGRAPAMFRHEVQRHPGIESQLLGAIDAVAAEMPVIFPVHPRTRQRLTQSGIQHHPSCGSFRQSGPRIFFVSWAKQGWSSPILVASRKKPQLVVSPASGCPENTERPSRFSKAQICWWVLIRAR